MIMHKQVCNSGPCIAGESCECVYVQATAAELFIFWEQSFNFIVYI